MEIVKEGKFEGKISDYYQPIMDYILLPFNKVYQTKGGIVIPEHLRERRNILPVCAVGPEVRRVKEGDMVFIAPNVKAYSFELLGSDYIQLREMDIFGVMNDEFMNIEIALKGIEEEPTKVN